MDQGTASRIGDELRALLQSGPTSDRSDVIPPLRQHLVRLVDEKPLWQDGVVQVLLAYLDCLTHPRLLALPVKGARDAGEWHRRALAARTLLCLDDLEDQDVERARELVGPDESEAGVRFRYMVALVRSDRLTGYGGRRKGYGPKTARVQVTETSEFLADLLVQHSVALDRTRPGNAPPAPTRQDVLDALPQARAAIARFHRTLLGSAAGGSPAIGPAAGGGPVPAGPEGGAPAPNSGIPAIFTPSGVLFADGTSAVDPGPRRHRARAGAVATAGILLAAGGGYFGVAAWQSLPPFGHAEPTPSATATGPSTSSTPTIAAADLPASLGPPATASPTSRATATRATVADSTPTARPTGSGTVWPTFDQCCPPTEPAGSPMAKVMVLAWCRGMYFNVDGTLAKNQVQIKVRLVIKNTSKKGRSIDVRVSTPSRIRLVVDDKDVAKRWRPYSRTKEAGDKPVKVVIDGYTYWAIPPDVNRENLPVGTAESGQQATGFRSHWHGMPEELAAGQTMGSDIGNDELNGFNTEYNSDLVFEVPATDGHPEGRVYGVVLFDIPSDDTPSTQWKVIGACTDTVDEDGEVVGCLNESNQMPPGMF